jgi:hypothetical protein
MSELAVLSATLRTRLSSEDRRTASLLREFTNSPCAVWRAVRSGDVRYRTALSAIGPKIAIDVNRAGIIGGRVN